MGVQSIVEGAPDRTAYDQRHGIHAKHYLTMTAPKDTDWVIARIRDRIIDKTVIEIGAGVGVFACELARYARHVYAIEVDLAWSWMFMRYLYEAKPVNLTWIIDRAENLVDVLRGDIAIVVTGSDEVALRELAHRFAPEVVMPWQDWNDGKARVRWGHLGRRSLQRTCGCVYGCVLRGTAAPWDSNDSMTAVKFGPGAVCQLRAAGVPVHPFVEKADR